MSKENGGPAFPQATGFEECVSMEFDSERRELIPKGGGGGMSLRDYFAAHVPQYVLDNGEGSVEQAAAELGIDAKEYDYKRHFPILQARRAYAYADAMLAARKV